MAVYNRSHPRVEASQWIYQNIPESASLSFEYWDDALPLPLPNIATRYNIIQLSPYDPESEEKWTRMKESLDKIDYVVLSSNRVYGSTSQLPERYSATNQYYRSLFDGSLGFKKVAEFTSRPTILLPFIKICLTPPFQSYGLVAQPSQECQGQGIAIIDDYADETFTVYDHPKVLIFKKNQKT